jgi:hypothetical protein
MTAHLTSESDVFHTSSLTLNNAVLSAREDLQLVEGMLVLNPFRDHRGE